MRDMITVIECISYIDRQLANYKLPIPMNICYKSGK